jgi:chemotaxis family two-component system response regulator Rcp1
VPIDILLVEDNDGDIRLMREILAEINPTARLHVVTDGAEAMDFLRYQGRYLDAPRPSVILLDLNLPKLHGREVLARVKANPHLQTIPVIVLTSSEEESDIASSYQLMANSYLRKPGNLDQWEQMVISLNGFWFTRVKLPKRESALLSH